MNYYPVIAVIPARIGSTRLPRKPLADLGNGRTMIQQMADIVTSCESVDVTIVTTDSEEVRDNVLLGNSLAEVIMTGDCNSGSERVWLALQQGSFSHSKNTQLILNVQGDEPLLKPWMLDAMVMQMNRRRDFNARASTLVQKSNDIADLVDRSVVKAVINGIGEATHFSRYPMDWGDGQFYKHIGVYAYNRWALDDMMAHGVGRLERMENLEQMRLIEMGLRLLVVEINHPSPVISVDTPEDLERVRRLCSHQSRSC